MNSNIWTGFNGHNESLTSYNYINFANGVSGSATVVGGSSVDIHGDDLSVNVSSSATAGIYGSSNEIHAQGTDSTIWVGGNGVNSDWSDNNFVWFATGDSHLHQLSDSRTEVYGSNISLFTEGASITGLYGTGIVAEIGGDNAVLWTGGNGRSATDSEKILVLVDANADNTSIYQTGDSRVDFIGNDISITVQSNAISGVFGESNEVHAQGDDNLIWIGGNGNDADWEDNNFIFSNGSNIDVHQLSNSRLDVYGNDIDLIQSGNATTGIYGAGNVVNVVGSNSNIFIGGNGNDADWEHNNFVNFATGTSGTVFQSQDSRLDVHGDNVTMYSSGDNLLGLYGDGNELHVGDDDSVFVGGGIHGDHTRIIDVDNSNTISIITPTSVVDIAGSSTMHINYENGTTINGTIRSDSATDSVSTNANTDLTENEFSNTNYYDPNQSTDESNDLLTGFDFSVLNNSSNTNPSNAYYSSISNSSTEITSPYTSIFFSQTDMLISTLGQLGTSGFGSYLSSSNNDSNTTISSIFYS